MKKYTGKIQIMLILTLIMPLFLFVFNKDTFNQVDAASNIDVSDDALLESEDFIETLSDNEIKNLTALFMDTVVQDIDQDTYLVLNYNSKEDLLGAFESFTTVKIGQLFIDAYYEEKEGGLYIIPTSTPPWFESENNYDVIQLDSNTVKVTQFNASDFYGGYQIELEFTFDGVWKITELVYP